MTKQSPQLTTLSEAQRAQALERFAILRPALEDGVAQTQIARTHDLPLSTVQRWIKRYRERGLVGLARQPRADRGKPRGMPSELVQVIEGLALQTPPRAVAAIHHQVTEVTKQHGCKPPSYSRVYQIVCCTRKLDQVHREGEIPGQCKSHELPAGSLPQELLREAIRGK
jgi:putative transposase